MARINSSRKRCWCISIAMAAFLLFLLAVVVPLAVLLPRRGQGQKSTLIFPLYVYPETNSSWGPLFDAVAARPELNFLVIVNPNSGPGSTKYPNDQYTNSLQKLNAYPNVKTVGYVRTGYATRNIDDVVSEVSTYAGWASNDNGIAMHGIFFDEAPHEYSDAAVNFMRTADQAAKAATGLQGDKTVIHNPGTIPDSRYNDTNADITVVFEDSYLAFQTAQASLAALPKHRSAYSYMLHSVSNNGTHSLRHFVNQLSQLAEYLFITDLDENYYESFGSDWTDFTQVVPT